MTPPFRQVEPEPWPSGQGSVVAHLDLEPEVVSERYGIEFFGRYDNLDWHVAAVIRLRSGRRVGLLRYRGAASPGVEVHVDSADEAEAARGELLAAFDLDEAVYTWVLGR